MSRDRVIGKDNLLPWHLSEDLKRFKQITMGHTIIMGRKTFDSIGKPLPGRQNFVLTRNSLLPHGGEGQDEGVRFFHSIDQALRAVKTEKAFVIGGADLYRQTIDRVDGIYMTLVKGDYTGDAFYPEIPKTFQETGRDPSADPALEFIFYEPGKKG